MNQISKDLFQDLFAKEEVGWAKEERRHAYSDFEISKYPDFRHGLNISVMPSKFRFDSLVPSRNKSTTIDIVADNKVPYYIGENIPQSIIIGNSKIDTGIFANFINEKLKTDKIYNLIRAFSSNVILLSLPEDFIADEPIYITKRTDNGSCFCRILIAGARGSKATIVINQIGSNSIIFEELFVECKEGAKIDVVTIEHFDNESVVAQYRSSRVLNDAEVRWNDLTLGSDYNKTQFINNLDRPGAKGFITALYLASNRQNYDLYTASYHNSPNTESDILTRGAVNDSAKVLSRGLVSISENASNSNGYEKQEALLLSPKAEADAIPNLEIHNGQVKCSHGSTIGQLDQDMLFYAMSRGLDRKQATAKIIEGYFEAVVKKLPEKAALEIEKKISEALSS